ncbi:MAG TPA: MFS transporter [Candidatus Solibacter sp.]|nr:MFS transporter [Candidatus Solibacter sp.]
MSEIGRDDAPSQGPGRMPVRATIVYCAIAVFLAGYGGSILFVALPGIATEFGANVSSLATLGSILSLGSAIGLPLAVVADRGRRGPVAAVGIAGFSLAGLVTAIVPSIGVLAIARLAAVCCETVVAAVATAATLEAVGSSRRGRAASLLALSGGAGATLSLVAYPLVAPHWRILYGFAGLGVLVAPLALRISSHRPAGAHVSARVLLDSPWRRRLLVLAASGALGALLYEPANFFAIFFGSRTLGLQPFALSAVQLVSGVAAAGGLVVGGLLSDRAGRRWPSVVLLSLSAVLTAISFTSSRVLYVGGNVLWSVFASASAPMLGAWTTELMPTRARVTGFTATGVAGALGGVGGLQLVRALAPALGLGGTLWLTAGAAVAGSLALLALPETRGEALPE